MNNTTSFSSKVLTAVAVMGLVFALNVSGALAGFWRTLDGVTSNGVTNPTQFLYGIGWDGQNTGVYGYGYGFGYGTFDAGYGYGSTTTTTTSSGGGGGGGGGGGSSSSSSSSSTTTIPTTPSTSDTTENNDNLITDNTLSESTKPFVRRTYEEEEKIDSCGTSIVNFNDISGHVFEDHIKALESISGLNGNGDGSEFAIYKEESKSYQPNRAATRSEYLKMVLRALCIDYSDMSSNLDNFQDVGVDSWQAKVINKAAGLNFISTQNQFFRPNEAISRIEALKIVMRAGVLTPLEIPAESSYSDVPSGRWESRYTEAALEYGIIAGNNTFRPYNGILRGEAAKLIMNTLH